MLVNSYYVSCLHFLLVFGFFLRLENSLKEKFDVASQRHPTEIEPVEKNGIVARCLSNVIAGLQNLWLWKPVQGRGSTTWWILLSVFGLWKMKSNEDVKKDQFTWMFLQSHGLQNFCPLWFSSLRPFVPKAKAKAKATPGESARPKPKAKVKATPKQKAVVASTPQNRGKRWWDLGWEWPHVFETWGGFLRSALVLNWGLCHFGQLPLFSDRLPVCDNHHQITRVSSTAKFDGITTIVLFELGFERLRISDSMSG